MTSAPTGIDWADRRIRALAAAALLLLFASAPPLFPPGIRVLIWGAAIVATGAVWYRSDWRLERGDSFSFSWLGGICAVALTTRVIRLQSIPQGLFVDELFTLRNTLLVIERPFDLFGMTPLMKEGWVVTSNLYLTFNALIVKLFGVSYTTVKLFSVIPGVLAVVFFYLACTRLFSTRVAGCVALLFAFSHWHIRLSRYGWDASFLVMAMAASLYLLVRSRPNQPFHAFLSGLAAAMALYSYINARLCVAAIVGYLIITAVRSRSRQDVNRLLAFGTALLVAAGPLLWYQLTHSATTWVRVAELSVFNEPHPLAVILANTWQHLLMFNVRGGSYARDNYPGIPMLDPISGVLLLVGIVALFRHRRDAPALLLFLLVTATMAGGIFSASQEGAPYAYRVSGVSLPAFLIVGFGLTAVERMVCQRLDKRHALASWLAVAVVLVAAPINLYQYFGLESGSRSAMRVMTSRYRHIGEAVMRTTGPVYLVSPGIFEKLDIRSPANDPYARFNGDVSYEFFEGASTIALMAFAGDYDWRQTISANYEKSRVGIMISEDLRGDLPRPLSIIMRAEDSANAALMRRRFPAPELREEVILSSLGDSVLRLFSLAKQ